MPTQPHVVRHALAPSPCAGSRFCVSRWGSMLLRVGAACLASCGGGSSAPTDVTPPFVAEGTVPAATVDRPAWWGFGRDAQHSALGALASQDLRRLAWATRVDLAPQYSNGGALLIHYGSPVVTSHNSVVLPVKPGTTGGFRIEARSGVNGGLIWSAASGSSGPVVEWCINTAAVDPATNSVLVNSEDGYLYRWHLPSNSVSQRIQLSRGIGEAYTPTLIGADDTVYAINNAVLFAVAR